MTDGAERGRDGRWHRHPRGAGRSADRDRWTTDPTGVVASPVTPVNAASLVPTPSAPSSATAVGTRSGTVTSTSLVLTATVPPATTMATPTVPRSPTPTWTAAAVLELATPTVSLTPVDRTMRVTAIEPATVLNDAPTRLTLIGGDFVPGAYTVSVGGRTLQDVRLESLSRLSGVLPAGLCRGSFPARVLDAQGQQVSGGTVYVEGSLSATSLSDNFAAPPISMVGNVQRVTVALPAVQIRDTTCGAGDLHLQVWIAGFVHGGGRPCRLLPLAIRADDAQRYVEPVTLVDGTGTATLVIARPDGRSTERVTLSAEIEVPSHPAAGEYRATVTMRLLEKPAVEAAPGRQVLGERTRPTADHTTHLTAPGLSVTGSPRTTPVPGEYLNESLNTAPTSPWLEHPSGRGDWFRRHGSSLCRHGHSDAERRRP